MTPTDPHPPTPAATAGDVDLMKTCNCQAQINENLKKEGLKLLDKCQTLRITNLKMSAHIGFPLVSLDGKKPKRGQATFLFLSFCPFCGLEYKKP